MQPAATSRGGSLETDGAAAPRALGSSRCPALAVGNQGVDVLHAQARVSPVESDGGPVRRRREVNELLHVLSARRRRRVFGELEEKIKNFPDILREIRNVFIE